MRSDYNPYHGVDDAEHHHFFSVSLCGNDAGLSDSESGEGANLSSGPRAGVRTQPGTNEAPLVARAALVGRKTKVSLEPLRLNWDQCGALVWRQKEFGVPLATPL